MSDQENPRGRGGASRKRQGQGQSQGKATRKGTPPGKGGGPRQGKGQSKGGPRRNAPDDTVAQLAGPLSNVLKRLPATQREVIEWRMGLKDGHPHDLADTARAMGISLSEARDIEKRAFEHIREVVPLERLQKLLKG